MPDRLAGQELNMTGPAQSDTVAADAVGDLYRRTASA
jgi:hypothetical protein